MLKNMVLVDVVCSAGPSIHFLEQDEVGFDGLDHVDDACEGLPNFRGLDRTVRASVIEEPAASTRAELKVPREDS